jgi:hypothetical protein
MESGSIKKLRQEGVPLTRRWRLYVPGLGFKATANFRLSFRDVMANLPP